MITFILGDIVQHTLSSKEGHVEYYLVYDVEYTPKGVLGVKGLKIFPVEEDFESVEILELSNAKRMLDMNAHTDRLGEKVFKFTNGRRLELGYKEIPPLIKIKKMMENNKKKAVKKAKDKDINPQVQDIIRYDEILSVDECLDAMNHLSDLHKVFGDDAYLQIREYIVKRLEDLLESNLYRKGR